MRNQFTFYASFFEAAQIIKNKQNRCLLYDCLCRYALLGEEPDLGKLPDAVAVAFVNARPNLAASRKKAENGKQGGSKPKQTESKRKQEESKPKQGGSEKEGEKENEKENENEIEIEGEKEKKQGASAPGSLFTEFFEAFPNKLGREKAWEAWKKLNPDEQLARRLMLALEAWKKSDRWKNKQGDYQFAPRAEAFLTDTGYVDAPPAMEPGKRQADEDEINAVRRMMQNEQSL